MAKRLNRRSFLKNSATATAGSALVAGLGDRQAAAASAAAGREASAVPAAAGMPTGKIGSLTVSRLIAGGNLLSGWSHARDLIYVHHLMRHYNTDEKIMDTLEKLEESGVNTIVADPSERPYRVFPKYWRERGGKIQWIAEGHPTVKDLKTDIRTSMDHGASAIYIQGVIGDKWLRSGHMDLLGECMEIIRSHGVPAGIGAHLLDVIVKSEEAGYNPDFYVKTLHHGDYWSARRPDQTADVVDNRDDNYWSMAPDETIRFMRRVKKPWIAFKVLAAGAIHPREAFPYAFRGGADFICVGMFDFQVAEDAVIAKKTLADLDKRDRPWRA